MSEAINFEKFRIKRATLHKQKDRRALPKHKKGEKFLRGPIPWNWMKVAACLPGHTLHISIAIWHLAAMKKLRTISLSNKVLCELGVKSKAGYRALKLLEIAKLISCERVRGRLPVVTILDVPALVNEEERGNSIEGDAI